MVLPVCGFLTNICIRRPKPSPAGCPTVAPKAGSTRSWRAPTLGSWCRTSSAGGSKAPNTPPSAGAAPKRLAAAPGAGGSEAPNTPPSAGAASKRLAAAAAAPAAGGSEAPNTPPSAGAAPKRPVAAADAPAAGGSEAPNTPPSVGAAPKRPVAAAGAPSPPGRALNVTSCVHSSPSVSKMDSTPLPTCRSTLVAV